MANTTNLNLVKPAGTDYALVSVINGNMDIIDSKVGAVPSNASVQGQIDTLNNQLTNAITKVSYATAFDITLTPSSASNCFYYADRTGKTIYYDIVFNSANAINANGKIAHLTGLTNAGNVHVSAIGSNGTAGRFRIAYNGDVFCESNIPAGEWFSFSGCTIYNSNI